MALNIGSCQRYSTNEKKKNRTFVPRKKLLFTVTEQIS